MADVDAAMERLERAIGHTFADPTLLERALSHRSWCAEHPGHDSNERLEFLGDSVLGLVVTEHLFGRFPGLSEGELAKVRASVVSEPALAVFADAISLGEHLRLGKGEDADGGRAKSSILADALEALLGALWLDGAGRTVEVLILHHLAEAVEAASAAPGDADHKTRLQELAAREHLPAPRYELTASGPDHERVFEATVWFGDRRAGNGSGPSKKRAEQQAAARAHEFVATSQPPAAPDSARGPDRASEDAHA